MFLERKLLYNNNIRVYAHMFLLLLNWHWTAKNVIKLYRMLSQKWNASIQSIDRHSVKTHKHRIYISVHITYMIVFVRIYFLLHRLRIKLKRLNVTWNGKEPNSYEKGTRMAWQRGNRNYTEITQDIFPRTENFLNVICFSWRICRHWMAYMPCIFSHHDYCDTHNVQS